MAIGGDISTHMLLKTSFHTLLEIVLNGIPTVPISNESSLLFTQWTSDENMH